MLRRFFVVGPGGLAIGKVFPARGEPREDKGADKDDEPKPPKRQDKDEPVPQPVEVYQRNNDDLVISNTTAETTAFSYAVPAGWLIGDHGVRVRVNNSELNNTAATHYRRWRIYLGATMLYDSGGFPAGGHSNSATPRERVWDFEVMAKNSDSIQEVFGLTTYATAAEDGNTELLLAMTVEMDTADPNFTTTHRRSIVELI